MKKKFFFGILAYFPLVCAVLLFLLIIIFMACIFSLQAMGGDTSMLIIIIAMIITSLLLVFTELLLMCSFIFNFIYYTMSVAKNISIPPAGKALWIVGFWFFYLFIIPIYWHLYLSKELEQNA